MKKYNIPVREFANIKVFNPKTCSIDEEKLSLPYNPEDETLLFLFQSGGCVILHGLIMTTIL